MFLNVKEKVSKIVKEIESSMEISAEDPRFVERVVSNVIKERVFGDQSIKSTLYGMTKSVYENLRELLEWEESPGQEDKEKLRKLIMELHYALDIVYHVVETLGNEDEKEED